MVVVCLSILLQLPLDQRQSTRGSSLAPANGDHLVLSLQSRPRRQVLFCARVAVVTVIGPHGGAPFARNTETAAFGTGFPFKLRVSLLLDASLNQASNLCGRRSSYRRSHLTYDPGCSEGLGISDSLSTLKPP